MGFLGRADATAIVEALSHAPLVGAKHPQNRWIEDIGRIIDFSQGSNRHEERLQALRRLKLLAQRVRLQATTSCCFIRACSFATTPLSEGLVTMSPARVAARVISARHCGVPPMAGLAAPLDG